MDFEYDSQPASAFHAEPMRSSGRISRCPALAHRSWSPFSSAPYHASPAHHVGWQQGSYHANHHNGLHAQQISSASGYSGYLPPRAPSLPSHIPEPRVSYSARTQETDVPATAVHNPSGYAVGVALLGSPVPPVTASSPSATSASPNPSAATQNFPPSRTSPPHTRVQPNPTVETLRSDAYSSSSPSQVNNPQTQPTAFNHGQREDQVPSVRPLQSLSTARVRLPAPGSRTRVPPADQGLTMALGHYARYRGLTDYYEVTDFEAPHGPASQTSDDDSDRDFSPSPYAAANHAYLRTARQSQILRGQMNNKRVASKKAIQSLQQVDLDSLPDNEKSMCP